LTLGIILMLVEVLFVPGTTLVGVLGVLVTGVGIYYGFISFETGTAITILGLALLANVSVIVYGFRSGVWNKFSLKDTISSRSFDDRLQGLEVGQQDRKSTRLNSSHVKISYAVFCLKKKKQLNHTTK